MTIRSPSRSPSFQTTKLYVVNFRKLCSCQAWDISDLLSFTLQTGLDEGFGSRRRICSPLYSQCLEEKELEEGLFS